MATRNRVWIDNYIQGVLVGRIFIYWLATILYFGVGIAVSQYCDHPHWTFTEHLQAWISKVSPWVPSILLLLPLVLFDFVRTTHAFAGPVRRVAIQLNNLLHNPNSTPLVLRRDDYWQEVVDPVNQLQNQILSLHMAMQKQRETIDELRQSGSTLRDQAIDRSSADAGPSIAQIQKSELINSQNEAELKALSDSITTAS
jgi:hypothetical protein